MKNTLFYHGTTLDGKKFTVAGMVKGSEDLILGLSLCSKADQFVKKIGRKKAEGRMHAVATAKGRRVESFYTNSFRNFAEEDGMFKQDWFKGREIEAFVNFARNFDTLSSKDLTKEFHLRTV